MRGGPPPSSTFFIFVLSGANENHSQALPTLPPYLYLVTEVVDPAALLLRLAEENEETLAQNENI